MILSCAKQHGYVKHRTRKTVFYLCVNDFGVKYHSKEDTEHLIQIIGKDYKYTVD